LQERVPALLPDDRDEVLLPASAPRIIPETDPEIVPDELQKA
jgi:hypothetical protein